LGLVACGDSGTEVGDQLTEAEAAAIAEFIMTSTLDATNSAQASPEGPSMAPYNYESRVELSAPCPHGGTVDVAADVTISGDTEIPGGVIAMNMVEVHKSCVGQDEETGQMFTLDGRPDLTVDFTLESNAAGDMGLGGSFLGRIAWQTEGRSGECEIDVTFTGSGSQATGASSGSVSGSVCGVSVTEQFLAG
jgi:hypothetical protein